MLLTNRYLLVVDNGPYVVLSHTYCSIEKILTVQRKISLEMAMLDCPEHNKSVFPKKVLCSRPYLASKPLKGFT